LANHRSAEKAARQAERRRIRNKSMKSVVKTQIRKAERLIAAQQLDQADGAVLEAIRILDKATQKGVLHSNNTARRKSRLMARYSAAKVAAATN